MAKDRWIEGYREGKVGAKYEPPHDGLLGSLSNSNKENKENAEYREGYEKGSKDR
jgi:hypothetical protein